MEQHKVIPSCVWVLLLVVLDLSGFGVRGQDSPPTRLRLHLDPGPYAVAAGSSQEVMDEAKLRLWSDNVLYVIDHNLSPVCKVFVKTVPPTESPKEACEKLRKHKGILKFASCTDGDISVTEEAVCGFDQVVVPTYQPGSEPSASSQSSEASSSSSSTSSSSPSSSSSSSSSSPSSSQPSVSSPSSDQKSQTSESHSTPTSGSELVYSATHDSADDSEESIESPAFPKPLAAYAPTQKNSDRVTQPVGGLNLTPTQPPKPELIKAVHLNTSGIEEPITLRANFTPGGSGGRDGSKRIGRGRGLEFDKPKKPGMGRGKDSSDGGSKANLLNADLPKRDSRLSDDCNNFLPILEEKLIENIDKLKSGCYQLKILALGIEIGIPPETAVFDIKMFEDSCAFEERPLVQLMLCSRDPQQHPEHALQGEQQERVRYVIGNEVTKPCSSALKRLGDGEVWEEEWETCASIAGRDGQELVDSHICTKDDITSVRDAVCRASVLHANSVLGVLIGVLSLLAAWTVRAWGFFP